MSLRILTIDDSRMMRHLISHALSNLGYQILEANDGIEGLRQFRKYSPDLILCDLRMPGMDGLEVLSLVVAESPELPIIILSGAGELQDAITAFQRGAWDYLTKPLDMAVLGHAITKSLERAQLLRENSEYRKNLEQLNHELKDSLDQLESDEAAGRQMQFQLLPQESVMYGKYQFSRCLMTSLYLSGDFVDYFVIDDQHLGFYMADVAGHGVPSALITVLLKSLINQYLEEYRLDKNLLLLQPECLLDRLNQNLLRGDMNKYLTIFYGIIDRHQNTLIFSNAGQFPAPMLVANGAAEILDGKDLPVGLFTFSEYHRHQRQLPEKFALVLFSDGILEVLLQPTLQEKFAYLLALINQVDMSIPAILDALHLTEHPPHLVDDVTLLLLKKDG